MNASEVIELTDQNFEQHVDPSDLPVLVDFWGEGCAPYQMIAPIIDQLATIYRGRVKVAKADVYAARQAAVRYRISAVPTLLILKGGQPVETLRGAQSLERLSACLDRQLESTTARP